MMQAKNKKSGSVRKYSVETYALFLNVDENILRLNPALEKLGYRFVSFNLKDIEQDFSDLILYPKDFKSQNQVIVDNSKFAISYEFYQSMTNNEIFGLHFLSKKVVYFLKRTEDIIETVQNNEKRFGISIIEFGEFEKTVDDLIKQLRLYKNGDVYCSLKFQISKQNRKVLIKSVSGARRINNSNIYSLSQTENTTFINSFQPVFVPSKLTELAISNFLLSYEITDLKTKYITLMTCLESIFNLGRDQITHTVSRHLSLIISKSKSDFQKNYYRTKQLYSLRSTIVHGNTPKENLSKAVEELRDKIRLAINYCLTIQGDKKQLFDNLNELGYNEED